MLTLLSLISAECCNCSLWDGPVSHGHPAHPDQELLRMGCLLLLLLFPSSSHQPPASKRDRGGFQCPSSLQAQEDQLPAALHQESHLHLGWNGMIIHFPFMARCEDLLLCQCPGFLPSSFLSLSSALLQKKKQPTKEKKPKKPTKNICSRIEVDIWNSPIAHWCCGWGKLLSFSGAAAATQGHVRHDLKLLLFSELGTSGSPALCLDRFLGHLYHVWVPPTYAIEGCNCGRQCSTMGDDAALWEMLRMATRRFWFSHHNHYDLWCSQEGQKFRFLLIYFPLTLILMQLWKEKAKISKLIFLYLIYLPTVSISFCCWNCYWWNLRIHC